MSVNRSPYPRVIALLIAIVSACSGPSRSVRAPSPVDRESLLLSTWTPPPGQTCKIYEPEGGLPALDDVLDSLAVNDAVARLWMAPARSPGYALFSLVLRRDSTTGGPRRVAVIESDLPNRDQQSLERLVSAHLRPLPAENGPSFRLKIEAGRSPRFHVGARETCRPVYRNSEALRQLLSALASTVAGSGTAMIWVFIDTEGRVTDAKLEKSSGSQEIDQLALRLAPYMQFHPALDDRVTVPVWVAVPVSVSQRRDHQPQ